MLIDKMKVLFRRRNTSSTATVSITKLAPVFVVVVVVFV